MPGLTQRVLRIFSCKQGKTAPAVPPPPARDDKSWQPGDQAECINEKGWGLPFTSESGNHPHLMVPAPGPAPGDVFIVTGVQILPHPRHGEAIFLTFKGFHGRWEAACFRKLQPVADKAEAADSTFLKDLRERLNPARPPVPEREDA